MTAGKTMEGFWRTGAFVRRSDRVCGGIELIAFTLAHIWNQTMMENDECPSTNDQLMTKLE
jgi:hypothetical protein